jgi:hypothetical protein
MSYLLSIDQMPFHPPATGGNSYAFKNPNLKIILKTTIFVFTLVYAACNTPTPTPPVETKQEQTPQSSGFISGEVKEINYGKDGYTARINAGGALYFVTISHANLKDPAQYKSTTVGAMLTVKGDIWKMGDETHVTVRELK